MTQPRLDRIIIVATDPLRNRMSGMSVQNLLEVSPGRDVEIGPVPLSEADLGNYAQQWNAELVVERDQLLTDKAALESQVATLTSERDSLQSQVDLLSADLSRAQSRVEELTIHCDAFATQLTTVTSDRDAKAQRIVELEGQLEALLNPPVNPRHLAPFDFLALLEPAEIIALQTSNDPVLVVGRAKLQTIITYVDLDSPDMIQLAHYMEQSGVIAAGRADRILSGQPPE